MSTLVQIKRSTVNVAPTTLDDGELAYSYVSNTLFIGTTANSVLNIGGKYYTDLMDNASAANGSTTFVRRYSNGSAQFSQLDILVAPTQSSHVATKQYVDDSVQANVTLASLNDVSIGAPFSDQNNKILIGNSAGFYVGTAVSGNVSISNTGVITIGAGQVVNSMLANAKIGVVAGAGLAGNTAVPALGETIQLDIIAGDGISNSNGDSVSVNSTVVRTDRNQTVNGLISFSNTVAINSDLSVTGNLTVSGNTSYINVATLNVADPLIFLAANNITSDIVDIGIFGTYFNGATVDHSGFVRHAADGIWYLFDHEIPNPANNVVDVANSAYALLKANLDAKSLNVNSGFANVNTTLSVTGNTTLLSNLSVSKNVTMSQNANVVGTFNVGSLLAVTGNTSLLANVSMSQNANVTGTLNVGSLLAVTDNTSLLANVTIAQNANISGTLNVSSAVFLSSLSLGTPLPTGSGGTGLSAFTANGVFYGGTTSTVSFATGSEGQVLQIASGVPAFAMLDGGSF